MHIIVGITRGFSANKDSLSSLDNVRDRCPSST